MKNIFFIIMVLFFSFKGISQNALSLKNEIMGGLVTSGSDASGSSGTIAYSIGQVFYTYIGSEMVYNVAQGMQHQEDDDSIEIPQVPQVPQAKIEILVFPNPTTDFVNINMDFADLENANRSYKIYNIQGRMLIENSINETTTQINLNYLNPSIYLLTVYADNKILKTFKIIKK